MALRNEVWLFWWKTLTMCSVIPWATRVRGVSAWSQWLDNCTTVTTSWDKQADKLCMRKTCARSVYCLHQPCGCPRLYRWSWMARELMHRVSPPQLCGCPSVRAKRMACCPGIHGDTVCFHVDCAAMDPDTRPLNPIQDTVWSWNKDWTWTWILYLPWWLQTSMSETGPNRTLLWIHPLHEFLLNLEATYVLGIKIDLFSSWWGKSREELSNFSNFPVALHWRALLREEVV